MRNIFFIFVAVTYAIMYVASFRIQKRENELVKPMNWLVLAASVTAVSYLIPLYIANETLAMICQGLYYSSIDWLLYVVIYFLSIYMNHKNRQSGISFLIILVSLLETVSFFINAFTRHAFNGQIQDIGHGESCFVFQTDTLYYGFHLFFTYALVVYIIIVLIRGALSVPSFYRKKYTIFLGMLSLIIILNALYLFAGQALDISLILYSLLATFLMHFSVIYIPKHLMQHAIACVLQTIDQGVICFDIDNRPIYANEQAKSLPWGINTLEEWKQFFVNETGSQYFDGIIEMSWEKKSKQANESEHSYRITYQKLLDENKAYIGCFFSVSDLTTERNKIMKADYRAKHDVLTGLYNKEYFYEKTAEVIAKFPNTAYLMVCTNIKDFKLVNDIFGPEMGDAVLCKIAKTLEVYNAEECCFGRLENDCFAICLPKRLFSEELLISQFKGSADILGYDAYQIHVHIGVYEMHDRHIRISTMCDRASIALHQMGNRYGDEVSYYDLHMMKTLRREKKLVMEFENAIKNGEFQIYLQPQIEKEKHITSCEVLVRWKHPEEGLIPPGEFIKVFERAGLIHRLDSYVWELTCAKLAEWSGYGISNISLSVNISEADFEYLNIYETLTTLVKKYKINPSLLHLEIAEDIFSHEHEAYNKVVNDLCAYGFCIEIDNFGKGLASINLLENVSVSVLKIDMSFVNDIAKLSKTKEILRGMILIAEEYGAHVLCEGIENEEQLCMVVEAGCEQYQGYYFARPMAAEQFEKDYLFQKN